jgi:hypothetical protein
MRLRHVAGGALFITLAAALPPASPVLIAGGPGPAAQGTPARPASIVNAALTSRTLTGSLATELPLLVAASAGVRWIAWSAPSNEAGRDTCCWRSRDGVGARCGCTLEDTKGVNIGTRDGSSATSVNLEADSRIVVLARVEEKAIQKVVSFAGSCELDAGGRPVVWLDGVTPADSIAVLARMAAEPGPETRNDRRSQPADGALTALAMHADAAADTAILKLAGADQPLRVRKQAIFWLGAARGTVGFNAVARFLASDPANAVREQAVFALSISKAGDGVPLMIDAAKTDASPKVRGQALFWLAQKAGAKVSSAIMGAIQDDPDTDVKKRAVFALSQLPKDEGVPLLIGVAKSNRNLEVRKQAMFWLGQSKDPRALAFFEQILTK